MSSVGAKLLALVDSLARYDTLKQEAPGFSRGVAHDAKNKVCFNSEGGRSGYSCDNHEPYEHLTDKWIIEAYNKLNF